jgi:hypothetical protein
MFCDLVGSTALFAPLDPEDQRTIITARSSRRAQSSRGSFEPRHERRLTLEVRRDSRVNVNDQSALGGLANLSPILGK